MTKVLGIIGGMGPLPTIKLFEKIVLLTKANKDQEHIHILIDNNTSIPDRTAYILDDKFEDPRFELIKSAKRLEKAGADFLIMPCNTAHHFYEEIKRSINIPFLNMIEETAKYIEKSYKNINRVGLLGTDGTIKAKIYDKVFNDYGIQIVYPSIENQKYVYELIYNIKEDIRQENLDGFYKAMDEVRNQGIDIFIAGCTEISVALEMFSLKEIS